MTIGLDIDDTITESSKLQIEYVKKHFNVDDANIVKEILGGEIKGELLRFYEAHLGEMVANYELKANAKEVVDRLRKNGHKIVIITARGYTKTKNDIMKITEEYFKKHHINVDKIIFNKLYKEDASLENKIDLMIDDSINTLEKIRARGIKTLLFTSISNKDIITDINRVDNWLELENYINNLKES